MFKSILTALILMMSLPVLMALPSAGNSLETRQQFGNICGSTCYNQDGTGNCATFDAGYAMCQIFFQGTCIDDCKVCVEYNCFEWGDTTDACGKDTFSSPGCRSTASSAAIDPPAAVNPPAPVNSPASVNSRAIANTPAAAKSLLARDGGICGGSCYNPDGSDGCFTIEVGYAFCEVIFQGGDCQDRCKICVAYDCFQGFDDGSCQLSQFPRDQPGCYNS